MTIDTSAHKPPHRAVICTVPVLLSLLIGCASPSFFDEHRTLHGPQSVAEAASAENVRDLPMYFGRSGQAAGWEDVREAVAWADVVVVGEQHDDAVGHAWQRVLVEDTMDRHPRAALSLEMLERDEQAVLDDYLDGIIDAEALTRLTHSSGWGGGGDGWTNWYLPIIDAAKERNASVIAANAPRRYVRLARLRGYDALRRLPETRRRLVELPRSRAPVYRQRFEDLMRQMQEAQEAQEAQELEEIEEASGAAEREEEAAEETEEAEEQAQRTEHGEAASEDALVSMFRSQRVWDATMADSIARAKRSGATKVIHLVGQFHSDLEGGLITELRKRLPRGSRVLVVTLQREWPIEFRNEDTGRADIVVYTGARPEEPEEDQAEEQEKEEPEEEEVEPTGQDKPDSDDEPEWDDQPKGEYETVREATGRARRTIESPRFIRGADSTHS